MEYSVKKNGVVVAIRIFMGENGVTPMAELAFAFGGSVVIEWTCPKERDLYAEGINSYTLFFDERDKKSFNSFVKVKTLDDFLKNGKTIINIMNEKRRTRPGSIVFENGWVGSYVKVDSKDSNSDYSVAMCDLCGYFDWDILNKYGAIEGKFICKTEEEICKVLQIIENL